MAKRKTYTSAEVKNRWNKKHYDRIIVTVPIGSKEEIQKLADDMGMSLAEYIRQAIRLKAKQDNKINEIPSLRGGGGLISRDKYQALLQSFREENRT